MIQSRLLWGLFLLTAAMPAMAEAKTGPTVYTAARQAAAYDNAAYDWSAADSHIAYTQAWLNLSLERVHALVPHPSLPRAHQVNYGSVCPNGKPIRRWYVDPDIRFKVKCMDTDDATPDLWYPQNDFEAHYARNTGADGEYVYPATDTTYCNPQNPADDCGYGAVINGQRWYFVAYYVYATLSLLARLDLGDPVNGRSLAWSGSLTSVFEGAAGLPVARRVAMVLYTFAEYFAANVAWYPIHLQRQPDLYNYMDARGFLLGRMIDGLVIFNLVRAYDIIFDVWSDTELLAALAAVHPDQAFTAASLRTGVAEQLFWPASEQIMSEEIWGNATLPHDVLLHIAWVLDEGARSQALIDWVFGENQGRLPEVFINSIDRDGGCDEVSATYCRIWNTYILDTGELLDLFNAGAFPLAHTYALPIPGFAMFERRISLLFGWAGQLETMPGFYVHLGDEGPTDTPGLPPLPSLEELARAFMRFGHDPQLAAQLYERNGNTTAGLHSSLWDADPFAVQQDVNQALQSNPALRRLEMNLAGYGFAQLRHLATVPSTVWSYFGRNQFPIGSFGHHGHHDQLDWGMQYANLDFMPTPGYPSGFGWRYYAWEANTASHSAVLVDRTTQSRKVWASDIQTFLDTPGSPVTVMGLQSRTAYPGVYEWPAMLANATLNRLLVKVPLGGGPFFVVELSSTRGGSVHHYSYHGGGPDVSVQGRMKLTKTNSTYATIDSGAPVAYEAPYDFDEVDAGCQAAQSCVESNAYLYRGTGFSFLTNTEYTNAPPQTSHFYWNQYNWQTGAIQSGAALHAYVTPLANINQIALATGRMPKGQSVRYMIVRGSNGTGGSALVNVWEPVSNSAQIKSVALLGKNIAASNVAAALSVTLNDGRVFYIGVDETGTTPRSFGPLAWTGRVAVYAEKAGAKVRGKKGGTTAEKVFAYLAEGASLAYNGVPQLTGETSAIVGTLSSVAATATTSAVFTSAAVDSAAALDRWVDIRSASPDPYTLWRDATFRIFGVSQSGGANRIDLGDVPLAGRYLDTNDYLAGIKQLANPGDAFRIPLDTWN